jgi:succinate-semialdehyde dehydrogenase/glutarate-semialdehyde dehydrogenase
MYTNLSLYIGGQFIGADERDCLDVVNPATEEVIGKLPIATTDDLNAALHAADIAFQSWRKSSPLERSGILRRVAQLTRERVDEIAQNITLDMGKPFVWRLRHGIFHSIKRYVKWLPLWGRVVR